MINTANTFADGLTSEKLKAVHGLWRDLAAGAVGPKRGQVTPARLRAAMPWTFIVETAGEDFRFSFAGDRIVQFMGASHAGILLSTFLGTPFFDAMNRFLAGAVATKAPMHAGPMRSNYPGKEHLDMEVIVLPLSEDGTHVSALLGALETWRAGTHTPA